MTILIKKNNQWLTIKNIHNYQNNQWKNITQCYAKQSGTWQSVWQNVIIFINDTPQTSINIFELMGNPTSTGNYIFINNAEIVANYGEPALKTGTFPKKSKLTIINNSYIRGYGGNGGSSSSDGQPGGDAIFVDFPCEIDNQNGFLYAGGGGGGGIYLNNGAAQYPTYSKVGGGGGAGSIFGIATENYSHSGYAGVLSRNPSNGDTVNGGKGGYTGNNYVPGTAFMYEAGNGGSLGEHGTAAKWISGPTKSIQELYAGGAAGLAINKNNLEVTVLNINKENIKGEIR